MLLVGRTRRSRGFLPFPAWTTLLSVCTNCICRLWLFDTTGFYAPSMAHNTSPMRPCIGVVVFFVCNSTDSKQLRICGQWQKPRLRRVLSLITFYFYMCICCSLHSLICLLARTDASKSHHIGYTSSALHFPVYSSA